MQPNLEDQAIKASLSGDWPAAITLNKQILEENPNHIPTLNRLAKAYAQTGQTETAIQLYQQVLSQDKFNPIAQKQCRLLKNGPCIPQETIKIALTDFVEIPGKTKTVDLVRLGDAKVLSSLQPGQEVNMVVKNHWILITSLGGHHIGCLTEDISLALKQKIAAGNQFKAVIRTADSKHVCVFIRQDA